VKVSDKKNELMSLDPELAAMMEMSSVAPAELRQSFHDEDRRESRVMLIQAMSELATAGEATPGSIVHGADGYVYAAKNERMTIVPILYFKSRRRYEQRDDSDGVNRILCESKGGRYGQGDPGGTCSGCSFSEWKDKPDGSRKPPECDPQHNVLVYLPDADESHQFALMSLARTSYGAGTKLVNKLLGLPGVFWMYGFQVAARQTEKGKQKWYVYDLVQWEDTNKFEKPLNMAYAEDWQGRFKTCEDFYTKVREAYDFSKERPQEKKPEIAAGEVPF
jgi:hypothetical protein